MAMSYSATEHYGKGHANASTDRRPKRKNGSFRPAEEHIEPQASAAVEECDFVAFVNLGVAEYRFERRWSTACDAVYRWLLNCSESIPLSLGFVSAIVVLGEKDTQGRPRRTLRKP